MGDVIATVQSNPDIQFWMLWVITITTVGWVMYRLGRHPDCPHNVLFGRKDCVHSRKTLVLDERSLRAIQRITEEKEQDSE